MAVLVTGGAGYIGAHVVRTLQSAGHQVVVVDDLTNGDAGRIPDTPLVRLDLALAASTAVLAATMREHDVASVIHLAARKQVAESVRRPLWYYDQNVAGLAHVLGAMDLADVGTIVYSSSAAVYGCVVDELVTEDSALEPVSSYGRTKLAGEWLLRDVARARGLDAVALRYFNVAGAGEPGLADTVVANLVTCVLDRLSRGLPPEVYGTDYPTADGSCVRDYVHVLDLAEAHVATLDRLLAGGTVSPVLNVGRGEGVSVLEVLAVLGEVSGMDTTPAVVDRRPGDPAHVVAAVDRIAQDVQWRARADLRAILASAWAAWQSGPRAL